MSPLNTLDATQFHLEQGSFLPVLIFHQRHFFTLRKQTVKIALVGAVLDQSVFFNLAFRKGLCDLMGEPTCVTQNLMLVKFEEMVQSQHPVLHRHGNVSASLMFRMIQIKGCCRYF